MGRQSLSEREAACHPWTLDAASPCASLEPQSRASLPTYTPKQGVLILRGLFIRWQCSLNVKVELVSCSDLS